VQNQGWRGGKNGNWRVPLDVFPTIDTISVTSTIPQLCHGTLIFHSFLPVLGLISPTTSSFYAHRSWEPKKDWQLDCLFALSGFVCVKADRRSLVKLTPHLFWVCQRVWTKALQNWKISVKALSKRLRKLKIMTERRALVWTML